MGKLFFFCLFVAAVPWTQAQARGHAVISLNTVHSGTLSVAPTVRSDTSTIVHVPRVNMNAGNVNSLRHTSNPLSDPLNNDPIVNPSSQQISPLQAAKPIVTPINPLGTTVETQTQTAVNGYTVPQVRQVQAALRRLGYYHGPVDGDFGENTQNALESYQVKTGRPVTGTLTLGVLSGLGANAAK